MHTCNVCEGSCPPSRRKHSGRYLRHCCSNCDRSGGVRHTRRCLETLVRLTSFCREPSVPRDAWSPPRAPSVPRDAWRARTPEGPSPARSSRRQRSARSASSASTPRSPAGQPPRFDRSFSPPGRNEINLTEGPGAARSSDFVHERARFTTTTRQSVQRPTSTWTSSTTSRRKVNGRAGILQEEVKHRGEITVLTKHAAS